jgi:hypothetical protein
LIMREACGRLRDGCRPTASGFLALLSPIENGVRPVRAGIGPWYDPGLKHREAFPSFYFRAGRAAYVASLHFDCERRPERDSGGAGR